MEDEHEAEEMEYPGSPPEIRQEANEATNNSLPDKSRVLYERAYNLFIKWCDENNTKSFSENDVLAYFQKLSETMKPSSLWSIYSMLRSTLNINNNIDISNYRKLCVFLKRKSDGYEPKKSKKLTSDQVHKFLTTAPDERYLFTKTAFIFGVMGACRRDELMKIEKDHVDDLNTALIVRIPDTKAKTERQFVISGNSYKICKKYIKLRPSNLPSHINQFFLNYQRGRCTKQAVGINKFGNLAKEIAKFLKLPDLASYTGHCLRKSSPNILVNLGPDFTAARSHEGWRSTLAAERKMKQLGHLVENEASTSTTGLTDETKFETEGLFIKEEAPTTIDETNPMHSTFDDSIANYTDHSVFSSSSFSSYDQPTQQSEIEEDIIIKKEPHFEEQSEEEEEFLEETSQENSETSRVHVENPVFAETLKEQDNQHMETEEDIPEEEEKTIEEKLCLMSLPSESWTRSKIVQDKTTTISLLKLYIPHTGIPIIEKQIVIDELKNIKWYVFSKQIGTMIFYSESFFQNFFHDFAHSRICYGGPPSLQKDLNISSSSVSSIDHTLNVWRHKKCSYFIQEQNVRGNSCKLCAGVKVPNELNLKEHSLNSQEEAKTIIELKTENAELKELVERLKKQINLNLVD